MIYRVLLLVLLTLHLHAKTHECEFFSIENTNKKTLKLFNEKEIKIYFIEKNNELVTQTLLEEKKSFFVTTIVNIDKEPVRVYKSKNKVIYSIYNDYAGGVRIIYKNAVVDIVNCVEIE